MFSHIINLVLKPQFGTIQQLRDFSYVNLWRKLEELKHSNEVFVSNHLPIIR